MTILNKAKEVAGRILDLNNYPQRSYRVLFSCAVALGLSVGFFPLNWTCDLARTGEINWFKQIEVRRVWKDVSDRKEQMRDNLYNRVFFDNGYANTDDDPKISFRKKFDAYRRMKAEFAIDREGERYIVRFSELSIEQLVQGINSYKGEQK